LSLEQPLSENARRILRVLRHGGMMHGYALVGRAGFANTKQLVDSLNPLFELGLVQDPGCFSEQAVLNALYYIRPSLMGAVEFHLRAHAVKAVPPGP
jgi:hypothetical protein